MDKITQSPSPTQRTTLSLRRDVMRRAAPPAQAAEPEAYCIWAEGRRGPRVKHPTKAVALAESHRLAALDKGRVFVVYALVRVGAALK